MRRSDWLEMLLETVQKWKKEPFEWGVNDCCLFAARCVDAMTDSSWVEDLQNHYQDRRTAIQYIADVGGIEAGTTARLGEPVPRLQARRGDVCLVETPAGYGLAVSVGGTAYIPGEKGLVGIPLAEVIKAWRVD